MTEGNFKENIKTAIQREGVGAVIKSWKDNKFKEVDASDRWERGYNMGWNASLEGSSALIDAILEMFYLVPIPKREPLNTTTAEEHPDETPK